MKKLILSVLIGLSISCLAGCEEQTKTTLTINMSDVETSINQPTGFIKICDEPISLSYDSMTNIIYMRDRTYSGYCVYIPYYAPNGKPYKYNPNTKSFEMIKDSN